MSTQLPDSNLHEHVNQILISSSTTGNIISQSGPVCFGGSAIGQIPITLSGMTKEYDRLHSETDLIYHELTIELNTIKAQLETYKRENGTLMLLNKDNNEKIAKLEAFQKSVEDEKTMSKLICALQDLNYSDKLEYSIPIYEDLRNDRVGSHRYLKIDGQYQDSHHLIDYKKTLILYELEYLSPHIAKKLSEKYDYTLIPETMQYLYDNNVVVGSKLSQKEKDSAHKWWST